MSAQLELPFSRELSFDELMARPCSWHRGEPDRSGLAAYLVLCRSRFDPERLTRAEARARGGGFEAWRRDMRGDPIAWAAAIVRCLRRLGRSSTFNGLVLELTGRMYTADVAFQKAPEEGLWLAVRRGLVWWSDDAEPGVVRFARRPRVLR